MSGAVELSTPIGLIRRGEFTPGATIHELIELHDIPIDRQPVVCIVNGAPVLRKDWGRPVSGHDLVQFVALPQGKQSGGIKGILRLVALVALAVVAPYAAGFIGGLVGVTGAVGLGLIQAGIMVAGAFLINALLSPSLPGQKRQDSETSPTYSLSAQGNSARLLQPIPRLYGRHILYPDFASMPFADYANNEQYLYQLFCLGVGEYDVEAVRIEETVVWTAAGGYTNNFDDVQIEIVQPGQSVRLVPLELETSTEVGGQELKNITLSGTYQFSGNAIIRSSGETFANIVPGDVLVISGAGANNGSRTVNNVSADKVTVTVAGEPFTSLTGAKTITLDNWTGPFMAVSANRYADRLAVDFIFPQGIGYANDNGGISASSIAVEVQARRVDTLGNPLGDWVPLGTHTYTRSTSTPQRVTQTYDVTLGRYEVRVRRTTERNYSNRYLHLAQWGGLRAYIPDDATYPDVTLLAVKMRATDQLTQQSSRKFNTIQTAKVPVWNGSSWSDPQASRSIAWAVADAMRNPVYGGKVPDGRIDLDKLLALHETWESRGDHFDGVFDTKRSLWEAVSTILRAGRAQPVMVAGVVTFVRDEPRAAARAVFTPRNTVKNSFESTHILYDENSPDDVIVEYIDQRTWKQTEVQCTLPGSTSEAPARIQLFGVTDRAHAWREGMYQAAANAFRRTVAKVTSELDGRVLIKGDPVIVSHDVPSWSQSGEVLGRDGLELTLSEPPQFKEGESHYLVMAQPNGREFGPILCEPHPDFSDVVVLDGTDLEAAEAAAGITLDRVLGVDVERDPTRFVFGVGVAGVHRFLLTTGTPRGLDRIDLNMVNDDPRVYSADEGTPPAEPEPIGPGSVPGSPVASGLSVVQDPNSAPNPVTVNASWPAAPGAQSYVLQISYDNVSWTTAYSGAGTAVQFTVQPGLVYFRLAGVNSFRGPWAYFSGAFGSATSDPSTPSGLTAAASPSAGTVEASWNAAARAQTYLFELYTETTPGSGIYNALRISQTTAATAVQLTSADIQAAGGPWASFQVHVSSVNASGTSLPATFTVSGYSLATPTGLQAVAPYAGSDLQLQWQAVTNAETYDVELRARGTLLANLSVTSPTATFTNGMLVQYGGPFRSMEIKVRARASSLVSGYAVLTAKINGVTNMWDFESAGTDIEGSATLTITGATIVDIDGLLNRVYRAAAATNRATSSAVLAASYTKAAWINPANLTGEKHIASGPNTSSTTAHALRLNGAVLEAGHGANLAYVASGALGAAGSWYHVAVTYDAATTTMRLYVNGSLVATNTSVPALAAGQPLTVGNYGGNTLGFVGDIDEVQLYSRALTATEINAIMR